MESRWGSGLTYKTTDIGDLVLYDDDDNYKRVYLALQEENE